MGGIVALTGTFTTLEKLSAVSTYQQHNINNNNWSRHEQ